ncbi:MAG TPA: HPF/RaiA family ribosome-associated protein, partial [Polyangiaceae bacterium]|nr:HPF/RaiA family ribosome-associated protein [Polyangiaceae bacterium]
MKFEFRSVNVPVSEALRGHVSKKLDFAIGRFARRVVRVVVRLADVNGPKGGPDKRCRIVARVAPTQHVVVEATAADAYTAVSRAALRLDEGVARALTKARSVIRDVSQRPRAARPPLAPRRRAPGAPGTGGGRDPSDVDAAG